MISRAHLLDLLPGKNNASVRVLYRAIEDACQDTSVYIFSAREIKEDYDISFSMKDVRTLKYRGLIQHQQHGKYHYVALDLCLSITTRDVVEDIPPVDLEAINALLPDEWRAVYRPYAHPPRIYAARRGTKIEKYLGTLKTVKQLTPEMVERKLAS